MIAAGPHGGDGARLAAALGVAPSQVLDLSASLNPVAPDPTPTMGRHLGALARYPDPELATAALAAAIGVAPERVLLTNGGAEAIALVAAELGPGWVDEPDFSLYRRHLTGLDRHGPRWRSNPHNPSGRLAPAGERAQVWDEAFWPLATGTWTRGDSDNGSIVLGSLTKLLACPGLRVGYILAPPMVGGATIRIHSSVDRVIARSTDEQIAGGGAFSSQGCLIERLAARQPRWAVNGLACAALPELLAAVDLPTWAKETARLREQLVALLSGHGLTAEPSDANWVLVRAPGLRDRLAGHAICVRDCASFGLPGMVRIAVPDDAGAGRLEEALCRG